MMLCGVNVVFNSLGDGVGLMRGKRSPEDRELLVGFETTEALGRFHHAGSRPPDRDSWGFLAEMGNRSAHRHTQ
jgi:hypothetical protein